MNLYLPTQNPVGKTFANWTPSSANWAQLADICQLDFLSNQRLTFSWQLAGGNGFANLPTDASPCFYSSFSNSSVGENSPSYYVGEGTDVPSHLRGIVLAGDQPVPMGCLVVLAIDLGTTTGWALRPRDGQWAHGFVSLKPHRFEGGGMRYLRFKRWLSELKGMATDIHGGLLATLTAWCEHHSIPYQGVPVGTIKKHATGKGNAGKDEVIAAMRAKGHPVTDDNEADALALLHWAVDTEEVA